MVLTTHGSDGESARRISTWPNSASRIVEADSDAECGMRNADGGDEDAARW